MSGKQRTVLWLGLILIGLNLVMKWPQIKSVIFAGAKAVAPSTGDGTSGDGGSGGGSVQIPIDPVLPTGPKITVPIPKIL